MPGVYISYPFCNQKCSFCNFASDVSSAGEIARYHHALLSQLRAHPWPWAPQTLYFGGGTPSLVPAHVLREIVISIPPAELAEVTMEAAPGTLTRENIAEFRRCGVNRVSLGVQSFASAELRQTGRRHTAQSVAADVALLREGGIENINIDLIAGLPEQTRESWAASIDWVERLAPPHVSVYIFEVDDDSRLGKEMLLGGVRYGAARTPGDDMVAELYQTAVERLAGMGIARYEISNFARAGFASRHNLKYWLLEPYVGFGLDAHSFDGHSRWSTSDSLSRYLDNPIAEGKRTPTDAEEEHFFVGLRLDAGIEPTMAEWQRFAAPIHKWTEAGLLLREGPRLRLAPAGVLLSNEIFEDFLMPEPVHA
jgi:oxygen-independent coproporphyrinogen-3 oxidase